MTVQFGLGGPYNSQLDVECLGDFVCENFTSGAHLCHESKKHQNKQYIYESYKHSFFNSL